MGKQIGKQEHSRDIGRNKQSIRAKGPARLEKAWNSPEGTAEKLIMLLQIDFLVERATDQRNAAIVVLPNPRNLGLKFNVTKLFKT
jgi:hypothetical protein